MQYGHYSWIKMKTWLEPKWNFELENGAFSNLILLKTNNSCWDIAQDRNGALWFCYVTVVVFINMHNLLV
jgi:hypothetical protein